MLMEKDFGGELTAQEFSNDETLCTREMNKDRSHVDSCNEPPNPPDLDLKKRRHDRSRKCLFDRLPEAILHHILFRLSIFDLLRAAKTCVAWHRMISSCKIFQKLYDKRSERSEESCIALCSPPNNPHTFCLFHINTGKWYFLKAECLYRAWLPQGAADGLMLFVTREGNLAVVNPLTTQIRILPDTQVTSRLRLQLALKRKVWGSSHMQLSINIVRDPVDGKTFKVVVWGELRTREVHVLVYNSSTDTWTTKVCSDQVDYQVFRSPTFSTVDGNTIYLFALCRFNSVLASYNIDTDLFVVQRRTSCPFNDTTFVYPVQTLGIIDYLCMDRVQILGIIAYRSEIHILTVIFGHDNSGTFWKSNPSALVGVWKSNPSGTVWDLLTMEGLPFPSMEVVAAYDGESSVTFIQSSGSMLILNLDSKEWKRSVSDPTATTVTTRGNSVLAFHMKLKFSTALA